jgi:hypothetical protein
MDVIEIIGELREELERIDKLILALDSLQTGKRRGRPPKLLQQLRQDAAAKSASPKRAKKAAKKKAAKKSA